MSKRGRIKELQKQNAELLTSLSSRAQSYRKINDLPLPVKILLPFVGGGLAAKLGLVSKKRMRSFLLAYTVGAFKRNLIFDEQRQPKK